MTVSSAIRTSGELWLSLPRYAASQKTMRSSFISCLCIHYYHPDLCHDDCFSSSFCFSNSRMTMRSCPSTHSRPRSRGPIERGGGQRYIPPNIVPLAELCSKRSSNPSRLLRASEFMAGSQRTVLGRASTCSLSVDFDDSRTQELYVLDRSLV